MRSKQTTSSLAASRQKLQQVRGVVVTHGEPYSHEKQGGVQKSHRYNQLSFAGSAAIVDSPKVANGVAHCLAHLLGSRPHRAQWFLLPGRAFFVGEHTAMQFWNLLLQFWHLFLIIIQKYYQNMKEFCTFLKTKKAVLPGTSAFSYFSVAPAGMGAGAVATSFLRVVRRLM